MEYSQAGIKLTQSFESCRLTAYPDSKGVPTIGWGHTRNVKLGDTCTQAQADRWLTEDVQIAVQAVNRLVKIKLTQPQFDALVDFVFNIGETNFGTSTLLRKLNKGDLAGASGEFPRWDMSGGQHIPGLLRRRKAEAALFRS